jgi:hypothetical protein
MPNRRVVAVVSAAGAALLLAACGGSASPLTAEEVVPKLEAAGITCTDTSTAPVEEGIAATAVTCALGETGGVVVIVADSADEIGKARLELCAQIPDEQGNLEVATGDAWLSVTLSTVGIGPAQVAEALGGTVSKITEYCAT